MFIIIDVYYCDIYLRTEWGVVKLWVNKWLHGWLKSQTINSYKCFQCNITYISLMMIVKMWPKN